jgi:hypothetical protein
MVASRTKSSTIEAGLEGGDFQLHHDVAQLGQVEEQKVDDQLLLTNGKAQLPANEGHPMPERRESGLQLVHQRLLQAPLANRCRQPEVVEDVGIAGQGLGQVGVRRRQGVGEVGRCGPDPGVQPVHDLVLENVAGPMVLDGLCGVPGA